MLAAVPGQPDGGLRAAGVVGGGPIRLLDRAERDRLIRIDFTGTLPTARAALAGTIERPGSTASVIDRDRRQHRRPVSDGGSWCDMTKSSVVLPANMALDYGPSASGSTSGQPKLAGFHRKTNGHGLFDMLGMAGPVTNEHAVRRLGRPEEVVALSGFPR